MWVWDKAKNGTTVMSNLKQTTTKKVSVWNTENQGSGR